MIIYRFQCKKCNNVIHISFFDSGFYCEKCGERKEFTNFKIYKILKFWLIFLGLVLINCLNNSLLRIITVFPLFAVIDIILIRVTVCYYKKKYD